MISPGSTGISANELAYARSHFFLPHRIRDPFHTNAVSTESRYDATEKSYWATASSFNARRRPPWKSVATSEGPIDLNRAPAEQLDRLKQATLDILETVGIRFQSPKALDILEQSLGAIHPTTVACRANAAGLRQDRQPAVPACLDSAILRG